MNNQQAIKILKEEKSWESNDRKIDAFNMAIEALEKQITICEEITEEWERKGNSNVTSSGYRNSGDCNSGNYNSGDCNSGYRNSGDCNSGNYNSGNYNSGNRNSGDCNSGYRNSGNRNSGDCNSGNRNSGDWNSGNYNSGDWNVSDNNSGIFNTEQHTLIMFDKPSDWTYDQWKYSDAKEILDRIDKKVVEWVSISQMTDEEKKENPSYKTCGGYLKVLDKKENVKGWWNSLTESEKEIIYALPNFDMEKFKKCVGLI